MDKTLHWESDWNGYEVGYPEIDVLGLYYEPAINMHHYIDTETGDIIESFQLEDE